MSVSETGAVTIATALLSVLAGDPVPEGLTVIVGVGADPADAGPHGGSLAPELGESPHATWYQVADKGFPQAGDDGTIRFQITVPEQAGAFEWNEWCIAVAPLVTAQGGPYLHQLAPGAVMVNRKVIALGVKDGETSFVFNCGLRVVPAV